MFPYRLEPIVALDSLHIEWVELLYGTGSIFPTGPEEWRAWYRQLPRYAEEALHKVGVPLSVNVDSDHILDGMALGALQAMRGLPIYVEWTERRESSINRGQMIRAGELLAEVCERNQFRLVLDDMGAGEDIMTRLVAVAANANGMAVKMDGALFQDGRRNTCVQGLLKSYIHFFSKANWNVCIEWVETEEDLAVARSLGARWGQGFLWSLNGDQKSLLLPMQSGLACDLHDGR